MDLPRPVHRSELRPRLTDVIAVGAVLSVPFVLAVLPAPAAVVVALSVAVACTVAYFAMGRRG